MLFTFPLKHRDDGGSSCFPARWHLLLTPSLNGCGSFFNGSAESRLYFAHDMKIHWPRFNRKVHYWGAIICAVPVLVVILSGILLLLKKESAWI